MTKPTMPNNFPAGGLEAAPAPLSDNIVSALQNAGIVVALDVEQRAEHGRYWWPLSIPDVEAGKVPHWPGAVVTPANTDQVAAVLKICNEFGVPVTAQGGRSGVVGGAVAPTGGVSLDLTGLDRFIAIDKVSGTVTVEAGMFGPDLEALLANEGFTVGHFPQSFDLATVGGWVACRGAGQFSNRYGKIEDIVRGLKVVLANGDVVNVGGRGPKQAVGPDLLQLFIGSEGTLGVITEVTMAMHPKAASESRAAYSFATFAEGLDACRRILQRNARPAVLRLYDEAESKRNFSVEGCALIVLDEGDSLLVAAQMEIVAQECRDGVKLDEQLVEQWMSHRNNVSQLVPLWNNNIVVDTIEVAGPWSILPVMHERVVSALTAIPGVMAASVHQSHAYLDGACLYFTFAGRAPEDVTEFYRSAWDAASKVVLQQGGALSHHHGVGRNRARFVEAALGSGWPVLVGVKEQLDPKNILNPGALGLGGPAW